MCVFLFLYFLPNAKSRFRCYPLTNLFSLFSYTSPFHTHTTLGVCVCTLWHHLMETWSTLASQSFQLPERHFPLRKQRKWQPIVFVVTLSAITQLEWGKKSWHQAQPGTTARNIDYEAFRRSSTHISICWLRCGCFANAVLTAARRLSNNFHGKHSTGLYISRLDYMTHSLPVVQLDVVEHPIKKWKCQTHNLPVWTDLSVLTGMFGTEKW